MTKEEIRALYFSWLLSMVDNGDPQAMSDYTELMNLLYSTDFWWSVRDDKNRAEDGKSLRYRFAYTNFPESMYDYIDECLYGRCSVLEMLVAFALRCEETIMSDGNTDRTSEWFWTMIHNLGLDKYSNDIYKRKRLAVKRNLTIFLERKYEHDGSNGGLFYISEPPGDMRAAPLWYQLMWYLESLDMEDE